MATRNEKIIGSAISGILGGILAYNWASKKENIKEENIFWYTLGGALLGGLGGYGLACLLGSPNDTVNYTHYYKGKRVYEGITYEGRFDTRMAEHKASGKTFTRIVIDAPKPRMEALRLEKERILKYRPINNIQHNSN